jgi:hypothetical protein
MKSIKPEDQATQVENGPPIDCDVAASDGRDEMCMREFLRTYVPVMV